MKQVDDAVLRRVAIALEGCNAALVVAVGHIQRAGDKSIPRPPRSVINEAVERLAEAGLMVDHSLHEVQEIIKEG
jgi:hypothetical protein